MKKVISYQGEPGANSHIACLDVYPDWEPLPCASFEDAFAAIIDGTADLGMIPIENSIAGRVADIHHFLPQAGLHIIGEYFLPIHFQLLALPEAELSTIRSVYSHVHALGQCRKIIRELGLKAVVTGDTAGSAREVAEWKDPTRASLAPALAAGIYGLKTLATDVEDEKHNTTRFIIMSKKRNDPAPGQRACKTSLVFQVRSIPAALYKGLGGFATNGVNVVKLESYMVDANFTVAQFYAEIEGHPADGNVALALEELQHYSTFFKVLGVYPKARLLKRG